VTLEELGRLIGEGERQSLLDLPAEYLQGRGEALAEYDSDIFVRYYSLHTRPWVPFHVDGAEITVNVALANDTPHTGGRLLALCGGSNQYFDRNEGDALVHSSTLLHAVTATGPNVARYSLIAFFRRRRRQP